MLTTSEREERDRRRHRQLTSLCRSLKETEQGLFDAVTIFFLSKLNEARQKETFFGELGARKTHLELDLDY